MSDKEVCEDTDSYEGPICPHCLEENEADDNDINYYLSQPKTEGNLHSSDESVDIETFCEKCGKDFTYAVTPLVSYEFVSYK